MNVAAKPMTEHSTDFELMFDVLSDVADEELSGVQARPVPDHGGLTPEAGRSAPAAAPESDEELRPGAFTEAFMAMVPTLKLGRKFWNAKSDDRHAELREKRKAERKARKKNRRTR